jgi:hypothetical protein
MKYAQMDEEERADFIGAIRDLADWLEQTPEAPLGRGEAMYLAVYGGEKEDCLSLIKTPGDFEKQYYSSGFSLKRRFRGKVTYSLESNREEVCERVVTGSHVEPVRKWVETDETQVVEDVEWQCHPLLSEKEA